MKNRLRKIMLVAGVVAMGAAPVFAGTDAIEIANTANSDFALIAPITILIATFYVVLKLAKRTVK